MRTEQIRITVPGQQTGPATLTTYLLDTISVAPERKRSAVLVVPGGGYHCRSDREKEPIARQFLAAGCHAFVLDYSVSPNRFPVSLQELAECVALIRQRAGEWSLDPERLYVCGFSAGGHLACSLGVFWNRETTYKPIDRAAEEIRPSGLILCYPVITSGEYRHSGSFLQLLGADADQEQMELVSLEKQVTADMPRTFLWHTGEDHTVPAENSLLLAMAMRRAKVPFELHLYPKGDHGLALANEETGGDQAKLLEPGCQSWISLVQSWIRASMMPQ